MAIDSIIQRRLPHSRGGRFASECPAGLDRNRWPVWIGMGGRFASEYALFYRSKDNKELTSICTAEKIFQKIEKYEEVIKIVGKRTVYSKDELSEILNHGPATIIIFLLHFELKRYISLRNLQKAGVVRRAPQSVMEISNERYQQILKIGGLDERFTLH